MTNAPISLLEAFEELRDPRARECAYQLDELLLAAICSVISGAESWTTVVEWSEMKLDWLRQHLPFANGIASHDTFGRAFSLLDATQFEACFVRWMSSICPSLEGQHIAIDGKCVRGSHDGEQSAIHLVSAWSSASGLTLGQVRTADKSNEITAIPELLATLDIKGAIINDRRDGMPARHRCQDRRKRRRLCAGREGQPARSERNSRTDFPCLLKQLRLSGILDSLEARNREAIDRKLAFTDFLSLLIHDEVARRDQQKLAQRMRRANFRNQKTLDGFDFNRLPGLNRAAVHDLATCRFIDEKVAVLIAGPCGTGKSHLAQSLGHAAARQGYDVLFIIQTQLMASLRTAQAMGTYERRLQYLSKVALLIIDDFGLKPLRPPEDEDFHDLIAERYERTATILTSNLHFDEWGAAFAANKMIGAATLDRLRHGAYKLVLDGESYRALPPASEESKPPIEKGRKPPPK